MAKIILPNKTEYRYATIPLFPGVKKINKIIAGDNLQLLKSIFDSYGVYFQLAAGTMLGAIRDKDFIDHDEDIDLAFKKEDREQVLNLLPLLRDYGFELCRFDRRNLYSLIRNGEYIDFYFFQPYQRDLRICSGWVIKEEHLLESMLYSFKGQDYRVPKKYE